MKRDQKNGMEWLSFELLEGIEGLHHAIFTKKEGFNLALHTAFDKNIVQKNLDLIKNTFSLSKIHAAKQVHEKDLYLVTKSSPEYIENVDALMTQEKGQALLITHADCQSALLYDPVHKAIANIHSGWRGSVKNIYKETIEAMQRHFQSDPKDLFACIGPSLGPDHAEFIHYKEEFPKEFWPFQIKENYFDFWALSTYQLKSCGILPHHIEVARLCTVCEEKDFCSYRRQVKREGKSPLKAGNGTLIFLS